MKGKRRKHRKYRHNIRYVEFILLLLAILFFSCQWGTNKEENYLYLNGRVEGDQYDVAAKYSGKVKTVFHDEGDNVKAGEVLTTLSSKEVRAELKSALAKYRSLIATVKAKEKEVAILQKKLLASKEKLKEAEKTTSLAVKIAQDKRRAEFESLKMAEAGLKEAMATYEKAKKDFERFSTLYRRRVISGSKFDAVKLEFARAKALLDRAKAEMKIAKANLEAAEKEISIAVAKRLEVSSLKKEIEALRETIKAKEEEVNTLKEQVKSAEGVVEKIKAILSELEIKSPISGTIAERLVEPGEVIAAGQKLFTIYNLDNLYFEGYIPENKLGLIRIGQKGYITVDAYPGKRFPVKVTFISSRAEFTPKDVQTKEERVKEVFRVKLKLLENPKHILKPGMPADCFIPLEKLP